MRPERNEDLSAELVELLGDEAYLKLVEAFGGLKLHISGRGSTSETLAAAIGAEAADRLVDRHGGSRLNVPLARAFRARKYREAGQGDAEIARRLGMTVSGLERLFNGMANRPSRRRFVDPRQISLPLED